MKEVLTIRRLFSRTAAVALSISAWAYALPAYAANIEVFGSDMKADAGQAAGQLADKMIGIVNMLAGFVGVVLFAVLVYAGFKLMTTGDNPQENARAKSILLYAIGGAALVFFAWLLARAVVGKLSAS